MKPIFSPGFVILLLSVHASAAPIYVEDLVRVKGQESTTIRGYGIVSGLTGTGDDLKSYSPAALAILRDLERSGMAGSDAKGIGSSKNNALVKVTVTIPASGGRDGDRLDCTVVALGNAKSLDGGILDATMLTAPIPHNENTQPLGMAWGAITTEKESAPNVGRIKNGCRLTGEFTNPYIKDGNVTLVIKKEHSNPRLAISIADAINSDTGIRTDFTSSTNASNTSRVRDEIARAIDSHYIVVRVPQLYFTNPLEFISALMSVRISQQDLRAIPRVTINERAGIIAIDENVEVKPTLITHKNIVADIEPELAQGEQERFPRQFVDVDSNLKLRQMNGENVQNMKLKALQASLDAIRVTPQEMIAIIKTLEDQGAIVGEVIFVE